MPCLIRQLIPDRDYPRVASILNTFDAGTVTVADLHERDTRRLATQVRLPVVAVDARDEVVGYAFALRHGSTERGLFWVWVVVDPGRRRAGIGAALFNTVEESVRKQGGTRERAEVRDNSPEALRWAEQRGFRVDRHLFESVLVLGECDPTRWQGIVERVVQGGLRFTTMAELGDAPAPRRQLYTLNKQLSMDVPGGSEGATRSFEEYTSDVFQAPWYRPGGQIVAIDGERWVGMSAVGYFPNRAEAFNMMTGVERHYRGRGIAQALKLVAVQWAMNIGATAIRTDNDSENAPMLAINHKLGYRQEPGFLRLIRSLEEGTSHATS